MERRHTKRAKERVLCYFGTQETDRSGLALNISNKGIFVQTSYTFKLGTVLQLKLVLPDNHVVFLEGSVRWVKRVAPNLTSTLKGGMGIAFNEPLNLVLQNPNRFIQTIMENAAMDLE